MKFIRDTIGQDLIEYMLLVAFLGIVGYTGIEVLGNAMRDSYGKENKAIQNIWETPPPIK